MAENPYRGQDPSYEQAWDLGYKYGYDNPTVSDYQAVAATIDYWSPYTTEVQGWLRAVWAEGALAGQQDGLTQGHAVSVSAESGESESALGAIGHVAGHGALEAGAYVGEYTTVTIPAVGIPKIALATEKMSLAEFGAAFLRGSIIAVVLMLITGVGETFPEDTADQLGAYLAQKCSEAGCSEFFLPYCKATGHSGGGSDDVFNAGLWHGPLYYDQDNAFGEAQQHVINEQHWGNTGILHYLPAEPNYMDWMVLNQT